MIKINNQNIRTTLLMTFWCLYSQLCFTTFSSISMLDFEQVNVFLVVSAKTTDPNISRHKLIFQMVSIFIVFYEKTTDTEKCKCSENVISLAPYIIHWTQFGRTSYYPLLYFIPFIKPSPYFEKNYNLIYFCEALRQKQV